MEVVDVTKEGAEEDERIRKVECTAPETRTKERVVEWLVGEFLRVGTGGFCAWLRSVRWWWPDTVSVVELRRSDQYGMYSRPFFTHLPVFLVVEDLVSVVHLYTTSTSAFV